MSLTDRLNAVGDMYLDLLKRTLTGMVYQDPPITVSWKPWASYDELRRVEGRDWPQNAHTMIGLKRLDNLQRCIETVLDDGIQGDLIETGVWRGGACIFMRGVLSMYGVSDRIVWVADSFAGFPLDLARADDRNLARQPEQAYLSVSRDEVVDNFRSYGLLDSQVGFIEGLFKDTLPGPVLKLAVLRLDSDLYDSTMDSIKALYPLLEPGGFCIVDDWNVAMCRLAVHKYRTAHGIEEPLIDIDGHSVYWRKDA